jgi:hypothetical protein
MHLLREFIQIHVLCVFSHWVLVLLLAAAAAISVASPEYLGFIRAYMLRKSQVRVYGWPLGPLTEWYKDLILW